MGRLENLPDNSEQSNSQNTAEVLKSVTQDLRSLQQDLVAQLNQDVRRLQAEKSRLLNDTEKLRDQYQLLLDQHQATLSRQQIAQQQLWAKQLAHALANHLQATLVQRLNQPTELYSPQAVKSSPQHLPNGYSENTHQLISSLDATLSHTFNTIRQDLNSYHSSLSQQISRMHNLEQQGEAILEVLVSRLSQQLQLEAARSQEQNRSLPSNGHSAAPAPPQPRGDMHATHQSSPPTILPVAPATAPEPAVAPLRSSIRPQGLSQIQVGLVFILLSTLSLSLHNVIVRIIGNESNILGLFQLGGFITLNSIGNSLLILWMRMLVVVPLMAGVASFLYPPAWRDIKAFAASRDRRLLRSVIGSGFFLFLSQVLIYIAFGQFGNPGIPVTILFMYPLVTVPLAWILFGDRPTNLRVAVMVAILSGVILTAFPVFTAGGSRISMLGIGTAVTSGIAFAFYLISMQISFRKLHPVPVSLIQFSTIFVLTSLFLIFIPLGVNVQPEDRTGLLASGIVLGTLTLIGYLLNNFGVRFMGAARASIVASSGPALTALLAFMIIQGSTALQSIQVLGIIIVTLGVAALSFERMVIQNQTARQPK